MRKTDYYLFCDICGKEEIYTDYREVEKCFRDKVFVNMEYYQFSDEGFYIICINCYNNTIKVWNQVKANDGVWV